MKIIDSDIHLIATCNLPDEVPAGYTCTQLTGDASTRSYFRIRNGSGSSLILMRMPESFDEGDFPYLQNYDLFRRAGVPLAEILLIQSERGFVFLQDLGDHTFYELYADWNEQTRLRYFLKTLDYLHQIEGFDAVNDTAFNTEKFLWELNYFRKYFLEDLQGISLSDEEMQHFQDCFQQLSSEISENICVLAHRDYHSRNLMLSGDEIYVIDFQDARMGPVTYDLASLCYDSYIHHSPEFIRHLEQIFFTFHPDARVQRFEYPRVCLQRNLKALGTFGYQATVMGRGFYSQFVPLTLSYVKQHLQKLPEYSELNRLLARHLPELA